MNKNLIFTHFLLLKLLVNVYSKDCLYSEKKLTEKLEKNNAENCLH